MSMEEVIHAALYGPEVKKLKVYDHEFNVKPVDRSRAGSRLIVSGQLSHCLSLRPDDQVYYAIVLENAVIKDIKKEIERGGLAPIAAPIISALAAYFGGIPVPPEQVESVGRVLGRLYDGNWESAATIMITTISLAISAQELTAAEVGKKAPRSISRFAVFPRDGGTNKTIITVTAGGRLTRLWDTDRWNLDFPAELAGQSGLRFQNAVAVCPSNAATSKQLIHAITTEGRLAEIWDTDRFHLAFPAELAGQTALRFQNGVAAFAIDAAANKKALYVITTEGRLAQVWDTGRWHLDFPAEAAGAQALRFLPGVAVYPREGGAKKSIYAVTTEGRLAQVWDTTRWHLDFPAEAAGAQALRFLPGVAVYPREGGAKKSIYAVTTEGRLARIWDTTRWNLDFPAELAGQSGLRFQSAVAVCPSNAATSKQLIHAITTEGRLAEIWDTDRFHLAFPAEIAGQTALRFQNGVAAFAIDAAANKKALYGITTEGRLAQVWDTGGWHLDFPVEAAGARELRF